MGSVKFSPGNAKWEVSQACHCRRFAPVFGANVIKSAMRQSWSGCVQTLEPPIKTIWRFCKAIRIHIGEKSRQRLCCLDCFVSMSLAIL